ncbi:MAG: S9 family peptidase [Acidobacteriota bacterium]
MMLGSRLIRTASALLVLTLVTGLSLGAETGYTKEDAARLRTVLSARISPDGQTAAYILNVPREPYEEGDGPAWTELHVVATGGGESRPYLSGEINLSDIEWTPDGRAISFLAKRGDDEFKSLYAIPVDGGEASRIVGHVADISSYSWSPDGTRVAFLATEEKDPDQIIFEEKGFLAEVYEEDLHPVRIWIAEVSTTEPATDARMLDVDGSASELHWAPVGSRLGVVSWSPDAQHLAKLSGEDLNHPNDGRLMIASASGGELRDLVPEFAGDVVSFEFRDPSHVVYVAHVGVESYVAEVGVDGGDSKTVIPAGGPIWQWLSIDTKGERMALRADSPRHPDEVYTWSSAMESPQRLTDSNPWLQDLVLAKQEVITYKARDGLEIEGLLIRPLGEIDGRRYPLIMVVHGGPESHYSNGWITSYSSPGQYAAADGYAVFYPNYRGSTGRGVAFSKRGQADYGGGEFNDLVDGIDHLVDMGLVDEDRVGVTGGSYGGFASAWCATALTEHFAAAVMNVGISDQISKFGTTDIPNEMFLVHARRWPWDYWDWFRERSPVYHARQARTPILILHGKDDTRVHPSQSMILYRYLKTLGNVPVRPGSWSIRVQTRQS